MVLIILYPEIIYFSYIVFCVTCATAPPTSGPGPLPYRGLQITHNNAPHSIELLWASDQLDAETSTWKHTSVTTDRHFCTRRDSNTKSQQATGRSPTPWNARPTETAPFPTCNSKIKVKVKYYLITHLAIIILQRRRQHGDCLKGHPLQNSLQKKLLSVFLLVIYAV